MYEKNLNLSLLLDFYGDLLTPKQREAMEFYYDEDMSLAEIAEHENITRQGVRDSIKRGEAVLTEMEEKLGLAARFGTLKQKADGILSLATEIREINLRRSFSKEIGEKVEKIVANARDIIR